MDNSGSPAFAGRFSAESVVDMQSEKHLELVDLTKKFGEFTAVEQVNFSVRPGEFLTLLGPSGSGKTTLLRMLGGFEYPTSGKIALHGKDVAFLPPYKRNIGMVFQKYALFPHMTVWENVAYPLKRRKIARDEIGSSVRETLELVGLTGFEKRYPRELSGGQQQRVALARAFVFKPEMLLMDEPLGALDKKLRDRMQVEIRALQQRIGITTVYVTHDQIEAMTMSDRVAVMHDGKVEQIGTPSELYENPKTEFVASFIGDSNLLPVQVARVHEDFIDLQSDWGGKLRAMSSAAVTETGTYKLLLRPEKIRLGLGGQDADNQIEGVVTRTTYLGDFNVYDVSVGTVEITVKQANRSGEPDLTDGQSVNVYWNASDCSVVAVEVTS